MSPRSLIYPKFRIWKWTRKFTLRYDGSNFNVVSDKRVRMAPPPSDPIADYQNETGFWASVVDRNGRVLYRRILSSPQILGAEVFTHDPAEMLYRVDSGSRTPSMLVVVIPDIAEGLRLDLFGSVRDAAGQLRPATRVFSAPLKTADEKENDHGRN